MPTKTPDNTSFPPFEGECLDESDYLSQFRKSRQKDSGPGVPEEDQAAFFHALDSRMEFSEIFGVVKKVIRKLLRMERAGIGMMLSDLPPELGAYWEIGGNFIVFNESLIKTMRLISKSDREFNSFIFTVLTHEYLHSLGFIEESVAISSTANVALKAFGPIHPASLMASGNIWNIYPLLAMAPHVGRGLSRIVRGFDEEPTRNYIS
jgi:hypothetical protein